MAFRDALNDGQPEAHALGRARVQAVKAPAQPGAPSGRHAWPIVGHAEQWAGTGTRLCRNDHTPARRGVAQGVVHQIADEDAQGLRFAAGRGGCGLQGEVDALGIKGAGLELFCYSRRHSVVPSGRSSSTTPWDFSSARMRSASAHSFRDLAWLRLSNNSSINFSLIGSQPEPRS
jgi:hypothetical protein